MVPASLVTQLSSRINVVGTQMPTRYDTPLIARAIKRLRKGAYSIRLCHPSGRLYGTERFYAPNIEQARAACKRLYPSTVFPHKRRAKPVPRDVSGKPIVSEPKVPYPFCRHAELCSGKGYCPRDPACND